MALPAAWSLYSNTDILKLDESCISNPKSETLNWTGDRHGTTSSVQFKVSDFGFEMQDSSNFKISSCPGNHRRSLKLTSTSISTGTGSPLKVPGSKRHSLIARRAF